jgi:hypothetical protein
MIRVLRTGATEASVVGVANTASDVIDLVVDGRLVATRTAEQNLDYWFLHVAVTDGTTIHTMIGSQASPAVSVPLYVAPPIGAPGFIYARGSSLARDSLRIQLFGVSEQTAFIYAMVATGLWGTADPTAWGKNQLFPSGPDTKIPGVTDADSLWREYFRYFLHYNAVAGTPTNPKVNLLRIWVADDSWNPEGTYNAWKANATAFWNIFDRMVYWANRSGVYLVPVLGHFATNKDNRFFNTSTLQYTHQVDLVRAIMDRYNREPRIAMWDLWNEPDVNDNLYWASVGGIAGFRAWLARYIADVKPHSSNHLITVGLAGWDRFPGVPGLGWQYHFFFNEIPGLEVSQHHTAGTTEDQTLIDWETAWHQALGVPHFEGDYQYSLQPGPNPIGYGYWPWYTKRARAAAWPALSTTVFLDDGKGAYSDYPYLGVLPAYPANAGPPNVPPQASFTFAQSNPLAAQIVRFDASASTDDVGIVLYEWDFGDGQAGSGAVTDHGFGAVRVYKVILTVWDADGAGDSATAAVSVQGGTGGPFTSLPSGFLWFLLGGLLIGAIAAVAGSRLRRRRRRTVADDASRNEERTIAGSLSNSSTDDPTSDFPSETLTEDRADQEIDELFENLERMEASKANPPGESESEESPPRAELRKRTSLTRARRD